ncbi:MAG TPA: hypothetical protein PKD90_17750 [Phnomibacter sp.]|nr:hypothetical protein [Phnomibacter sp.]
MLPLLSGYTAYNFRLQFAAHEEGRRRALRSQPQQHPGALMYDYMLKNHLGNVRMVLTQEEPIIRYPAATLEGTAGGHTLLMQNPPTTNAHRVPQVPFVPVVP